MHARLLVPVAVALTATITQGRSFFLSPSGVDVSGGGTSIGAPWKTISYATNQMQAGDTLLLNAGTYVAETHIDINNGGSSSSPMVIKNRTSVKPVIDLGYIKPLFGLPQADSTDTIARLPSGQAARTGAIDNTRNISVQVDNVIIDGLIIQGCETGIWAQDWSGTHVNLQIRNCIIRDNEQYAVRLNSYDNVRIDSCDIYDNGLINWPRTGDNGWPHSIIGWSAHHVVVAGCSVHDNHGEGVGPFQGCAFWEIRNSQAFDNWSVNIYIDLDSTNAIVDGNLTYNTGKYGTTGRNMPDGIRIANEIADMDYSAYGTPQDPTPAVTNVIVTNNICVNTGGGICAFSYAPYNRFSLKNSVIANNTIVNVPSGFNGVWVSPGDSVDVSNNLIVGCASPTVFVNVGAGVFARNNIATGDGGFVSGAEFHASSYKLTSASVAINAGITESPVTTDFFGVKRPQSGAYDVGACEYTPPSTIGSKTQSVASAKQRVVRGKMRIDLQGRKTELVETRASLHECPLLTITTPSRLVSEPLK